MVSILCKRQVQSRNPQEDREIGRKLEQDIPVISLEYMGPKSGEDRAIKIMSHPIIVRFDLKKKLYFAQMVPKKGHDAHAIKIVAREVSI